MIFSSLFILSLSLKFFLYLTVEIMDVDDVLSLQLAAHLLRDQLLVALYENLSQSNHSQQSIFLVNRQVPSQQPIPSQYLIIGQQKTLPRQTKLFYLDVLDVVSAGQPDPLGEVVEPLTEPPLPDQPVLHGHLEEGEVRTHLKTNKNQSKTEDLKNKGKLR